MLSTEFKELGEKLRREYGACRVWVYGSHARGTADEESDVDLLIVGRAAGNLFDRMAAVRRLLRDERKGRAISPLVLTPEELEARIQKGDQFFEGILREGIEI